MKADGRIEIWKLNVTSLQWLNSTYCKHRRRSTVYKLSSDKHCPGCDPSVWKHEDGT